jgi:hypothetical protein
MNMAVDQSGKDSTASQVDFLLGEARVESGKIRCHGKELSLGDQKIPLPEILGGVNISLS